MLPPIHNPARSQPCGRCAPKSLYLLGSGVIRQQRPDSTGETWYDLGTASDRSAWMGDIPSWHIVGDWFDNCSCAVACPCTFAQAPDNGFCESVLFWSVREGHYGDVKLDNLSLVRVGRWEGDLWARNAAGVAGLYIDEHAGDRQTAVVPAILGGHAAGLAGGGQQGLGRRRQGGGVARLSE